MMLVRLVSFGNGPFFKRHRSLHFRGLLTSNPRQKATHNQADQSWSLFFFVLLKIPNPQCVWSLSMYIFLHFGYRFFREFQKKQPTYTFFTTFFGEWISKIFTIFVPHVFCDGKKPGRISFPVSSFASGALSGVFLRMRSSMEKEPNSLGKEIHGLKRCRGKVSGIWHLDGGVWQIFLAN